MDNKAPINWMEALSRQYQNQQAVTESLSQRLAKYDQVMGETNPQMLNDTLAVPRAFGESPLTVEQQRWAAGAEAARLRDGLTSDVRDGNALLLDLIGKGMAQNQFDEELSYKRDRDTQSDLLDMLKLQNESGLVADADGNMINPSKWFISRYGHDAFGQLGKSENDRQEAAETIFETMQDGKEVALNDLLSSNAKDARNKATELMRSALEIYSGVTDQGGNVKNAAGVGILGGLKLNPITALFGAGQDLRSKIANLTATKIKELSGAAVSDKEVQRLANMLPKPTDTEQKIAANAKTIATSIQIGLDLQEKAVRENLTLDQAYEKYGAELYRQHGEEIPSWLNKGGQGDSASSLSDDEIKSLLQ